MEQDINGIAATLMGYAPKVVGAIIILALGWFAAGLARKAISASLDRANIEVSLSKFAGNMAYWAVLVFTVVAALAKFGVETTSFVAILGAASFAVGMALQGSLGNFAAGVMILLFKPFKVGDFIDAAGVAGTVKEIDLFTTNITTGDNVKMIVPNGALFGGTIKNFSAYDKRRVDLVIGIGYSSSIEKAMETLQELCDADERIHKDPEVMIRVSELADSSVNIILRAWTDAGDYWPTKFDLTHRIKNAFDEKGIEIPFPQRVVHLMKEEAGS